MREASLLENEWRLTTKNGPFTDFVSANSDAVVGQLPPELVVSARDGRAAVSTLLVY